MKRHDQEMEMMLAWGCFVMASGICGALIAWLVIKVANL